MRTILALRASGLGDVLATVPALRAVRRARPDHRLVLAGPSGPARLLLLDGLIDQCVETTGLDRPIDWAGRVDIAVNLHGRGPQSHRLLLAKRPRELVAYAAAGIPGPMWDDDEHERRRWCRLVAECWDTETDWNDVMLMPPMLESSHPQAVVVHPGAAHAARRWPAERWASVIEAILPEHPVVLTGSASERRLAANVARLVGLGTDCVLAGHTSIVELASLVARARLVLCGDTGVSHLATAYGTPSISLFGPTPPSLWGPCPNGTHQVLWKGTDRSDPWAEEVDEALLAISVDEVIRAAEKALSE